MWGGVVKKMWGRGEVEQVTGRRTTSTDGGSRAFLGFLGLGSVKALSVGRLSTLKESATRTRTKKVDK